MLSPGELFEGYRIFRLLGESSFACAFLADSSGGERVVLKIFKDEILAQEKGFAYLQRPREAITQGRISNQAYLVFYRKLATADISGSGRHAYLVRSYVEGVDLANCKATFRTNSDIITVVRKICLGLAHLHQAGIIHGGLCPSDIFIGDNVVKITDFGTGASFLGPLLRRGFIQPDKCHFIPPWRNDPHRFNSPATDIYALGALLYLLQEGCPPEGIPNEACVPVRKALEGGYGDVDEFLQDVELPKEEEESGETEKHDYEKERRGSGEEEKNEEKENDDSAPEPAPRIEIRGAGLETTSSGLTYRLEQSLAKKAGTYTLIFKNLETKGKGFFVAAAVASGADWIEVEPREVVVSPGEQEFRITVGPVQTRGVKEGKVVLAIAFDGIGNQITRDILIRVTFTWGFVAWAVRLFQAALLWIKAAIPALCLFPPWPNVARRFALETGASFVEVVTGFARTRPARVF